MSEKLFDVFAVNIETGEERVIDRHKTEANAEAIVKFCVIHRGVDTEFFVTRESTP